MDGLELGIQREIHIVCIYISILTCIGSEVEAK